MRRVGSWRVALALAGAVAVAGCGSGGGNGPDVVPDERPVVGPDTSTPDAGPPDAGPPDAGPPDAGPPDAGPPDAGPPDAGPPDAGPQPLPAQTYPQLADWRFYGPEAGGPNEVLDVAADGSGNLWVAGGEDGLFLLRKTADGYAQRFERFTMADGLRPYGYMPNGSEPPGEKYLNVLSVEGGPGSNTVFVGYKGKPPPPGIRDCESNWDSLNPEDIDPSIYKSGDADRVTLTPNGLQVVHYDIYSGLDVVKDETRGREKICNIYRMAYDPASNTVWFGANHGFARGEATYPGNPTCGGQMSCWPGEEHTHPAVADARGGPLTDGYFGLAPIGNGDVWIGGAIRSAKFRYGTFNRDYWVAAGDVEAFANHANRLDVWADPFYEVQPNGDPTYYTREMRKDDNVSAMALSASGGVYVSSFNHGLKELSSSGAEVRDLTPRLLDPALTAMARDAATGTLWVGYWWGGGVSRLDENSDAVTHFYEPLDQMGSHPVLRLRVHRSGGARQVLVAFGAREIAVPDPANPGKKKAVKTHAGALGIYTGP